MEKEQKIWEKRYAGGIVVNRYPFDMLVSFVMRQFGKYTTEKRAQVRLLDYGCGTGNHATFMAGEGFSYYGIDYTETATNITREALASQGISSLEDRVKCGDFLTLPFKSDFFDAVVDRQSLGQNTAERLPQMVSEITRVLKPGGIYWGINFSDRHPQLKFARRLENGDYDDFSEGTFKGLGLRHFFSVQEIYELFSDYEIQDIRIISARSIIQKTGESEQIVVTAKKQ